MLLPSHDSRAKGRVRFGCLHWFAKEGGTTGHQGYVQRVPVLALCGVKSETLPMKLNLHG
jgi:hypothetical protein